MGEAEIITHKGMKMRYICEAGSTSRAKRRFHHVNRLGRLLSIKGYRYSARRISSKDAEGNKTYYRNTFERVLVTGVNGTARFDGVLWGYGGEGPRGLVELLIVCGLERATAEEIAFNTPRRDEVGVDWELELSQTIKSFKTATTLKIAS